MGCGAVSVIHIATPRAMPSMPRVTRKDGMATIATSAPLMAPTRRPVSSPTASPGSSPKPSMVMAAVTEARPATAPTDRSICAAPMTNVMATAMTVMTAVWRNTLSRLVGFRKPESASVTAKKTKMMTKPM